MRRNRWLVFLGVLVSSPSAIATTVVRRDGPIPDLTSTSADGRLLFMARWPDSRLEARGEPRGIRYSLNDLHGDRILWERLANAEEQPRYVYVDNRGRTVILTRDNLLVSLDAGAGEPTLRVRLLDLINDGDRVHLFETTAGISIGWVREYFLTHGQRTYFVLRTWWDRRFFFDLDGAEVVERPDSRLLAAAGTAETDFVLGQLQSEIERLSALKRAGSDGCCIGIGFTQVSVDLAGRMGIKESIQLLRDLEDFDYVGISGGSWDSENQEDGEIDPFNREEMTLRRSVHLALRKLGEKPKELPLTRFRIVRVGKFTDEFAETHPLPAPRSDRVGFLRHGMKPREILRAIGAPDYVFTQPDVWEYDMDASPPYTLRIEFLDRKRLSRLERLSPPAWQRGEARYER